VLPFVIKRPKRGFPVFVPVLLLLVLAGITYVGWPEPRNGLQFSRDAVRGQLTNVIESQLAAFRADDYARAYTFAAAGIREQFLLADFEAMVKQGYPLIAESVSATFGIAFDNGREALVVVSFHGRDKRVFRYNYMLLRERDGWKVNGVFVAKPGEPVI